MSEVRIAPGTRLNGIYEVDTLIASGGMGEVYKGRTIHTNDAVAIKILRPEFGENEAALGLFRREASALHNLTHDAIVRYYVCSVDPDLKRPYLAMEFVEGRSLSQLLREGPLTFEAVRTLAQRIASGLQAAHERNIVHRDVAPDNIIISGGDVGRAKIIDFGIARWTQVGEGTIIGGGFAGKYNYVSPEQLGLFGGDVTARSDIYSLGLVLAEALNGRPLDMGGSQAQIVEKRRKVPDLGGVDMRLRPLLEQMLQPDPADRLQSMTDVAGWFADQRQKVRPSERAKPRASRSDDDRPARRRGLAGAAAALLGLAAGLGAGAGYYLYDPALTTKLPSALSFLQSQSRPGEPKVATATPAVQTPALTPAAPALSAPPPPSLSAPPPALSAPPPPALSTPPPALSAPPAAAPSIPPVASLPAPSPSPPPAQPAPPSPPPLASPAPPPLAPPPSLAPPSQPPVAALSPAPPPTAAPRVGRIDAITQFINSYDGGDCFFVLPISVGESAARIEGLGASVAPFQALDEAFKRTNGFEPDIGVRQVKPPQCPAVTFINRQKSQRTFAPQLEISETNLKSGQALAGTIDRYGTSHVELVLVADDGSVHNLTRLLRTSADSKTFNLRMQLAQATGAQPQMLLAVTSSVPLSALQLSQPGNAAAVFAAASNEAMQRPPVAVTARYFRLE